MRFISTLLLSCMLFVFACNIQKAMADESAIYYEYLQHLDGFLQTGNTDFDLERYKQSKDSYLLVHFAITWMWNTQHIYDAETPDIVACTGDNCKHGAFMVSGKRVQETLKDTLKVQLNKLSNLSPAPVKDMPAYYFNGTDFYFKQPTLLKNAMYVKSVDKVEIRNGKAYLQGSIASGFEKVKIVGTFEAVMTKEEMPHVLSFKSTLEKQ